MSKTVRKHCATRLLLLSVLVIGSFALGSRASAQDGAWDWPEIDPESAIDHALDLAEKWEPFERAAQAGKIARDSFNKLTTNTLDIAGYTEDYCDRIVDRIGEGEKWIGGLNLKEFQAQGPALADMAGKDCSAWEKVTLPLEADYQRWIDRNRTLKDKLGRYAKNARTVARTADSLKYVALDLMNSGLWPAGYDALSLARVRDYANGVAKSADGASARVAANVKNYEIYKQNLASWRDNFKLCSAPHATKDSFEVEAGKQVDLNVLLNDTPSGGSLRIVEVKPRDVLRLVGPTVATNGRLIQFSTPKGFPEISVDFDYVIENHAGKARAGFSVHVVPAKDKEESADTEKEKKLLAEFAMKDAERSRAISAQRQDAESQRRTYSADAFDTAVQQYQATATQLSLDQQRRNLNARSLEHARRRRSTVSFPAVSVSSGSAPDPESSSSSTPDCVPTAYSGCDAEH